MEEKKDLELELKAERDKDKLRKHCLSDVNGRIDTYWATNNIDTNLISDGYHTFGELYEHRYILWFKLCEIMCMYDKTSGELDGIIKAKRNHDGSVYDGYFLLGYTDPTSKKQISYHLPISFWDKAYFATEFDIFPNFDGHTSADVLERLKNL